MESALRVDLIQYFFFFSHKARPFQSTAWEIFEVNNLTLYNKARPFQSTRENVFIKKWSSLQKNEKIKKNIFI